MSVTTSTKYAIIKEMAGRPGNKLETKELCEIAGVSRSGRNRSLKAELVRQQREERDKADFAQILAAYSCRGCGEDGRGIQMRLLRHSPPVLMDLKKVSRLMRKYGLLCPIRKANPYRRMMKALKENNYAANILNREFKEHGARAVLQLLSMFEAFVALAAIIIYANQGPPLQGVV